MTQTIPAALTAAPPTRPSVWLITCAVLLCATLKPGVAEASTDVTATKDCSVSPCAVIPTTASPIKILVAQTVYWQADRQGSGGNDFYLTTNPLAHLNDIPLSTSLVSGLNSGSFNLAPGTYYISIRLSLMGPGTYTVTFNPSSTGEPHITTINGARYDFQAAGEFVLLRHTAGLEIQTRQTPVATKQAPCVSVNGAVAARVGRHRVTYEPNLSGRPDPTGLQLRIDGTLTNLGGNGINFRGGGRVSRTPAPGGLRIDFPDGSSLFVTPGWWGEQNLWYLNLDMAPARVASGIAGPIPLRGWLPALPDGSSMGQMPSSAHDRFVDLNHKFADAWRVSDSTSLFDYAPGTSTSTFTDRSWPPERPPPCDVPGRVATEPTEEGLARAACRAVTGQKANCVFDVMVTGNPGFAITYAYGQTVQSDILANADTDARSSRWWWILLGLVVGAAVALIGAGS